MKLYDLKNFTRGWIVGDFTPTILPVTHSELMIRHYKKGDMETKHIHKIADEITVIVNGKFRMNDHILVQDDIIHLSPGDATDFECLEDGSTAVYKTPSVMGDKYIVE